MPYSQQLLQTPTMEWLLLIKLLHMIPHSAAGKGSSQALLVHKESPPHQDECCCRRHCRTGSECRHNSHRPGERWRCHRGWWRHKCRCLGKQTLQPSFWMRPPASTQARYNMWPHHRLAHSLHWQSSACRPGTGTSEPSASRAAPAESPPALQS